MTHTCKVCGVTSDVAEFYNGVRSRCKECHKKGVKENRDAKADYYRKYDAERFRNDPRVKQRHKRYQKTDAGKESLRKARKKWINKRPEARAAHIVLGNAVRDGGVKKPGTCSNCGNKETSRRLHGHHDDYARPLDVVWLCVQCHREEHKDDF